MAVISYKELLTLIPQEEPSARLAEAVMQRIERRQMLRLRLDTAVYGCIFGAALASFVSALSYLVSSISSSGVSAYASLIASDSTYLAGHWNDVLMSVASAWPLLATTAAVAIALISIYALRRFVLSFSELSNYRLAYP